MSAGITNAQTLLYGVLVTEESYYLSLRSMVKLAYAKMLISKVTARDSMKTSIPQELQDMMIEELHEQEMLTAWKKWNPDCSINSERFDVVEGRASQFELDAIQEMTKMEVARTGVFVSAPNRKDREQHYIHLCAAPTPPSLSFGNYAPTTGTDSSTSTIKYAGSLGETTVRLKQSADWSHLNTAYSSYVPKPKVHPYYQDRDWDRPNPMQCARLVVHDNLEHAMRNWNAENLDKLVKLLRLEIVPCAPGDPRKPHAVSWNIVYHKYQ